MNELITFPYFFFKMINARKTEYISNEVFMNLCITRTHYAFVCVAVTCINDLHRSRNVSKRPDLHDIVWKFPSSERVRRKCVDMTNHHCFFICGTMTLVFLLTDIDYFRCTASSIVTTVTYFKLFDYNQCIIFVLVFNLVVTVKLCVSPPWHGSLYHTIYFCHFITMVSTFFYKIKNFQSNRLKQKSNIFIVIYRHERFYW